MNDEEKRKENEHKKRKMLYILLLDSMQKQNREARCKQEKKLELM